MARFIMWWLSLARRLVGIRFPPTDTPGALNCGARCASLAPSPAREHYREIAGMHGLNPGPLSYR